MKFLSKFAISALFIGGIATKSQAAAPWQMLKKQIEDGYRFYSKNPIATPVFIKEYSEEKIPSDVKKTLDDHTDDIKNIYNDFLCSKHFKSRNIVENPKWLSNYYIKFGYLRAPLAHYLNKVIQDNNLDCLAVPKKYLYHIPGKPLELSDENYVTIAEKITATSQESTPFTLKQVKQLCALARYNLYSDFHNENFLINSAGKIVIIDTDLDSAPHTWNNQPPEFNISHSETTTNPIRFFCLKMLYMLSNLNKHFPS